ncbi:hypothetical protein [Streptomyces antimycoticus]|uniref:hypothetical protein n=1 Tax=Streptomyces antimycoticus TaxID=68175 RepID=UPI000A3D4E37|nr:hypothetical protein [Streptomyces antimycoticus]
MKLVTQVKLVPDAVQAPAFERTLPAVNEAANWVSAVSSLPNTAEGESDLVFRSFAAEQLIYDTEPATTM